MIHYTCDRCERTIDADAEQRYVVRIDVEAIGGDFVDNIDDHEAIDFLADLNEMLEQEMLADFDDDTDSLDSLHDALARGDDLDHAFANEDGSPFGPAGSAKTCQAKLPTSFDLCPQCYAKYLGNPLGRDRSLKLHFSNN